MSDTPVGPGLWSVRKVRDLSISLLIVIIAIKIAFAEFKFDMSAFNFSDLLSLILTISAVGLSVAFYFKADESAKQFYDNSYNFTKDVATILGRIETGFSEKLSTLNKGYDDINRRLGQSSGQQVQDDKLDKRISQVESKLKQSIDEILQALAREGEDTGNTQKLKSEVEGATHELGKLRAKQAAVKRLIEYHPKFVALMSSIARRSISNGEVLPGDTDYSEIFESLSQDEEFGEDEKIYMLSHKLLNEDDRLTSKGSRFVRNLMLSL